MEKKRGGGEEEENTESNGRTGRRGVDPLTFTRVQPSLSVPFRNLFELLPSLSLSAFLNLNSWVALFLILLPLSLSLWGN